MHAVANANRQEQQNYVRRQQQLQAEIEQVCEYDGLHTLCR
jgi:hypothetical protein